MAWTAPRTWVAGEVVTAALLNTHVRDNEKAIGDPWTAYGSGASWTATTNPALGNGTWDGRYMQAGKYTSFVVEITMGTTTTYGTGQWRIALPFAPVANYWRWTANCFDTSASAYYETSLMWLSAGPYGVLWAPTTVAGNPDRSVTGTSPFTWAVGDVLTINGTYQAG